MDAAALSARYRAYIACLNARRFDALGTFVAEVLTYNGTKLSLDDYRAMLVGDTTAIPDLAFVVGLLVAEHDHVAARLDFACTPQRDFLGFRPNGRPVAFSENVFYRFAGGRIVDVWSVIDRTAIERQLGSASRLVIFEGPEA